MLRAGLRARLQQPGRMRLRRQCSCGIYRRSGVRTGRRQRQIFDGFPCKAHVATRYLEFTILGTEAFELEPEHLPGRRRCLTTQLSAR